MKDNDGVLSPGAAASKAKNGASDASKKRKSFQDSDSESSDDDFSKKKSKTSSSSNPKPAAAAMALAATSKFKDSDSEDGESKFDDLFGGGKKLELEYRQLFSIIERNLNLNYNFNLRNFFSILHNFCF